MHLRNEVRRNLAPDHAQLNPGQPRGARQCTSGAPDRVPREPPGRRRFPAARGTLRGARRRVREGRRGFEQARTRRQVAARLPRRMPVQTHPATQQGGRHLSEAEDVATAFKQKVNAERPGRSGYVVAPAGAGLMGVGSGDACRSASSRPSCPATIAWCPCGGTAL
jgi:hypothetical protein